jgi:hypothetical protein
MMQRMLPSSFFAYLFLAFVFFSSTATAGNVNLGALVCDKSGYGVSFILYSFEDVECTYHGIGGPQNYTGKSGILIGVDLEGRYQNRLVYMVMGGAWYGADQLAGYYTGVKVSASVGVGPTVQAGLGGAGSGISLVPLSFGGSIGLGAAGGISYLTLSLAEPGTASTIPLPDELKMKAAAPMEAAPKKKDLLREEQTTDKNAMENLPGEQTVKPEDLDTLVEKKIIVEQEPAIAKTADKPVSEERFIEGMKDSNKPLEDGIIREWNKRRQAG